jgi:hypothetical protein
VDAPDQARTVIGDTRATYIVTCESLTEYRLYGRENPQGLAALLAKDMVPTWLEAVPTTRPLHIYRIRRD